MDVVFRRSFLKDIRGVDSVLARRIERVIMELEQATSLYEIRHLKRLAGSNVYYRIRVGNYRIGLRLDEDRVTLVRFLHRKDIYRYFP